jgi:hypothetical protein
MKINEIVQALNAGASADIWYDPDTFGNNNGEAEVIKRAQNAMTEAAKLLKFTQVGDYEITADALGHWAVCEAGAGDVIADLMTEDVAYMICAALNLNKSGEETPEPTIPEGSFHILVGRDATAYFDAIIPAASLEEAKGKISKDGYDCDDSVVWTERSPESFDHIEVCVITSPDGTSAHWEEQTLWDEE